MNQEKTKRTWRGRIVSAVLALSMVFALTSALSACGGAQTPQSDSSGAASSGSATQSSQSSSGTPQSDSSGAASSSAAAQSSQSSSGASTPATAGGSSWDQWSKFLVEYDAWADEYIAFMKKYTANPTDLGLLKDYSRLAAETQEFQKKAAQVPTDLTPEQTAQSTEALMNIAKKLTAAMTGR